MKAEHRKELRTNYLADHVGRLLHNLKAKPSTTTTIFWAAVVLVIGGIIGWRYISKSNLEDTSHQWVQLDEAASLEQLRDLAQASKGTPAGRAVRFQIARVLLSRGLGRFASPTTRDDARNEVEEAGKQYAELADEAKDTPLLAQEALTGAAKARESLGDLEGARTYYQRLVEKYKDSAAGKAAKERLDKIDQGDQVGKFYGTLDQLAGAKGR